MDSLQLVNMDARHVETLAALEALCFSSPWSEEALLEETANPNAHFIVGLWENEIAGYAGMHCAPGACYMDNVAVFPKYRKKGVGKALVNALWEETLRQRAELLSLEVRPSNQGAVLLYEKLGFSEQGRRRNFYTAPVEDALILTKFVLKG